MNVLTICDLPKSCTYFDTYHCRTFYFIRMYEDMEDPASWRYYGLEKRLPLRRLHLVFA